jgi:hypothetical protein
MLPVMHTAHTTRGIKPSWEPLLRLVGNEVVTGFMWMYALRLDDGTELHAYKSIATRRPLLLGADGRAFQSRNDREYEEVSPGAALLSAFEDWEELVPQPRNPDAVRELLQRHRSVASQEIH